MSTNDVPGAVAANNDVLDVGCWAEHTDGSLILVKGLESKKVIYEVYDLTQTPILTYQDAMPQSGFEKQYSWDPHSNDLSNKWIWHDKTKFPWDRVMDIKNGAKPGLHYASAMDQISAAAKVAASLKLKGAPLRDDMVPKIKSKDSLLNQIQSAIDTLPPDEAKDKIATIIGGKKKKRLLARLFSKED